MSTCPQLQVTSVMMDWAKTRTSAAISLIRVWFSKLHANSSFTGTGWFAVISIGITKASNKDQLKFSALTIETLRCTKGQRNTMTREAGKWQMVNWTSDVGGNCVEKTVRWSGWSKCDLPSYRDALKIHLLLSHAPNERTSQSTANWTDRAPSSRSPHDAPFRRARFPSQYPLV